MQLSSIRVKLSILRLTSLWNDLVDEYGSPYHISVSIWISNIVMCLTRYCSLNIYHGCNNTYEEARREVSRRTFCPCVIWVLVTTIYKEGRVYHFNWEQGVLIYQLCTSWWTKKSPDHKKWTKYRYGWWVGDSMYGKCLGTKIGRIHHIYMVGSFSFSSRESR